VAREQRAKQEVVLECSRGTFPPDGVRHVCATTLGGDGWGGGPLPLQCQGWGASSAFAGLALQVKVITRLTPSDGGVGYKALLGRRPGNRGNTAAGRGGCRIGDHTIPVRAYRPCHSHWYTALAGCEPPRATRVVRRWLGPRKTERPRQQQSFTHVSLRVGTDGYGSLGK